MRSSSLHRIMCLTLALGLVGSACSAQKLPGPVPGGILVATADKRASAEEMRLVWTLDALGLEVVTSPAKQIAADPPDRPVYFQLPAARSLSDEEVVAIRDAVERGGALAVEGRSKLAEAMGVRFEPGTIDAQGGRGDARYDVEARWRELVKVPRFSVDADGTFLTPAGDALQAEGELGRGRFVFFAVPAIAKDGEVRFPGLAEVITDRLGAGQPALVRPSISAYVVPDPERDDGVEELTGRWVARGLNAVHIAGWRTDVDYGQLVAAVHRAGLRAYLWLSPPMLNDDVWNDHAECRQKTASGRDAEFGERKLMALEVGSCMKHARDLYTSLLERAPWDGVNITDLNYQSGDAEHYTPFHPEVRKSFQERAGFDPVRLFDDRSEHSRRKNPKAMQAFEDHRSQLVTQMHRDLVGFLEPRLKNGDMVVTLQDDVLHEAQSSQSGIRSSEILALRPKLRFRVQVEDGVSTEPAVGHYQRLREAWMKRDQAVSVDLSVVGRRGDDERSLSGAELALAATSASNGGRLLLSPVSSVADADWPHLQEAMAASSSIRSEGVGYEVDTKQSVLFRAPGSWTWASLDGRPARIAWERRFMVPAGKHTLRPAQRPEGWLVEWTSCDSVTSVTAVGAISYTSTSPCYWRVSGLAKNAPITIDGVAVPRDAVKELDGQILVPTPRGKHTLSLTGAAED